MSEQKMNPEIKAQWVAALRSGEYRQGHGYLRQHGKFCCLGVLCDLHAKGTNDQWDGDIYKGDRFGPGTEVTQWAFGGDATRYAFDFRVTIGGYREFLSHHNDSGRSFAEIADAIEAQL